MGTGESNDSPVQKLVRHFMLQEEKAILDGSIFDGALLATAEEAFFQMSVAKNMGILQQLMAVESEAKNLVENTTHWREPIIRAQRLMGVVRTHAESVGHCFSPVSVCACDPKADGEDGHSVRTEAGMIPLNKMKTVGINLPAAFVSASTLLKIQEAGIAVVCALLEYSGRLFYSAHEGIIGIKDGLIELPGVNPNCRLIEISDTVVVQSVEAREWCAFFLDSSRPYTTLAVADESKFDERHAALLHKESDAVGADVEDALKEIREEFFRR